MTSVFHFDRSNAVYTPIFQEAVNIVDNILRNREVVIALTKPILAKYPKAKGSAKITNKLVGDKVTATINAGFDVSADAQSSGIMQIIPRNNQLRVNPKFLTCTEGDSVEKPRCLLLLVVKLLHQILHALTSTFFEIKGHEQERDELGALKYLYAAPLTIGRSFGPNRQIIGHNGYAFEEHFLKGRLGPGDDPYKNTLVLLLPDNSRLEASPTYIVPDELAQSVLATLRKDNLTKADVLGDLSLLIDNPRKYKPQKKKETAAGSSSAGTKRGISEEGQPTSKKPKVKTAGMSLLHSEDSADAAGDAHASASKFSEDSDIQRLIYSHSDGIWKE